MSTATTSRRFAGRAFFGSLVLLGMVVATAIGWFAVSRFFDVRVGGADRLSFDGTRILPHQVGGFYDDYTIDLILKSDTVVAKGKGAKPLPAAFVGGGMAILQNPEDKYRFFVAGQGIVVSGGQADKWQRLALVVSSRPAMARIFINGKKVWQGTGKFGMNNSVVYFGGSAKGNIRWKGDFWRLRVYDGPNFSRDFDPDQDIRVNSVIKVDEIVNRSMSRPRIGE